ncbi:MAG: hypothetical protein WEA59_02500 [Ferruginibacter sp.]
MAYILFVLYAVIIGYLIPKISFIKKSGLRPITIRILYAIKVFAGVGWGYINIHYLNGVSDPVALNNLAMMEHQFLTSDPRGFIVDLFSSPYHHYSNFFGSANSYWNDLDVNILAKTIALFNFITTGNFYVNTLIGVLFSFFGNIALFRVYTSNYATISFAVVFGSFLIPTMLVFTASNSKDNVCFTLLALCTFAFYQCLKYGFTSKKIIFVFLMFLGLLLFRNHLALLMIPSFMIWYMVDKKNTSAFKIIAVVYGCMALLLLLLSIFKPSLNPAQIIAQKQQAFLAIPEAKSQLPMDTLHGSFLEIIQFAPTAINHGFLRPYIWEVKNVFNIFLCIEILATLFLMAFVLYIKRALLQHTSALVLFGITIAVTMIILTGYITPNFNAIARYKSTLLPFLLIPFLFHFPCWPKLFLRIKF